jgi:hypothetical protein
MNRTGLALALSTCLFVSGTAVADEARYSMTETDDGFLRLDTQSGEVSHCSEKAGGFSCELAADERAAYEAEIAGLSDRLARLEAKTPAERAGVPTDEELDEAFGFFETMTKRFARAARVFGDEMQKMDEELQQNPLRDDEKPENGT